MFCTTVRCACAGNFKRIRQNMSRGMLEWSKSLYRPLCEKFMTCHIHYRTCPRFWVNNCSHIVWKTSWKFRAWEPLRPLGRRQYPEAIGEAELTERHLFSIHMLIVLLASNVIILDIVLSNGRWIRVWKSTDPAPDKRVNNETNTDRL